MKLVTFESGNEERVGVVQGDFVVDIAFLIESLGSMGVGPKPELKEAFKTVFAGGPCPFQMIDLLELGEAWRMALHKVLEAVAESNRL